MLVYVTFRPCDKHVFLVKSKNERDPEKVIIDSKCMCAIECDDYLDGQLKVHKLFKYSYSTIYKEDIISQVDIERFKLLTIKKG